MSANIGTKCEIPKKHWNDYSADELRVFLLKNRKKSDCSFIIEDQGSKDGRQVYESFKWIVCDMSPVLKEILNDTVNQAKNCKEIVVSNPKYLEKVLIYGHTKIVSTDLVDFYEASKQFQVKILEDEIIKMFDTCENQENADWVKLFWLSYVKYSEDKRMRAVFAKVKHHANHYDPYPGGKMDLLSEFNEENFDKYLDIMVRENVHKCKCFKLIEAYLIKYLFDGDKEKQLEVLDPIERDIVDSYLDKLQLWYVPFDELQPLLSSKIFHKSNKIKVLYKKARILGEPSSSIWNRSTFKEFV